MSAAPPPVGAWPSGFEPYSKQWHEKVWPLQPREEDQDQLRLYPDETTAPESPRLRWVRENKVLFFPGEKKLREPAWFAFYWADLQGPVMDSGDIPARSGEGETWEDALEDLLVVSRTLGWRREWS